MKKRNDKLSRHRTQNSGIRQSPNYSRTTVHSKIEVQEKKHNSSRQHPTFSPSLTRQNRGEGARSFSFSGSVSPQHESQVESDKAEADAGLITGCEGRATPALGLLPAASSAGRHNTCEGDAEGARYLRGTIAIRTHEDGRQETQFQAY